MGECATEVAIGTTLYKVGVQNSNVASIIASTVGILVKSGYIFAIEARFVDENVAFLDSNETLINPSRFISIMQNRDELLKILIDDTFLIAKTKLYIWSFDYASSSKKTDYLEFLTKGLQEVGQAEWDAALASQSPAHAGLITLGKLLKASGSPLNLELSARDAILEKIRSAARGDIPNSANLKQNILSAFDLVRKGSQTTLVNNVVEDLASSQDASSIIKTISLSGEFIPAKSLLKQGPDRVLARIFSPIVSALQNDAITWILVSLRAEKTLADGISQSTMSDFSARLEIAINETSDDSTRSSLQEVAEIFKIDFTKSKESETGDSETSESSD